MAETKEERRARLEAELRAIEEDDREAQIEAAVKDVSLPDVLDHLVRHSGGYPTVDHREVHARAVRKHYKTGEYAPEEAATVQDDGAGEHENYG